MEDDWEQIADQVVDKVPKIPKLINKWDGEDEDDEVKESWEDDDEDSEKKDEEKKNDTPVKQKPKKTLAQKIAEKERLRQEELERKRDEEQANWTPEQKAAEKLRLQQLQEENDLKMALGTLGLTSGSGSGIDAMVPNTKEEFTEFADAISKKLAHFREHEEFPNFLDELVRNVCAATSSSTIRKVKTSLDNLYLEKQKMEKGDKPKKGKGAKGKAKLRMEGDDDYFTQANKNNFDDEYDDFM